MYRYSIVAERIEGYEPFKVESSSSIVGFLRGIWEDMVTQETFYLVLLDNQLRVLGYKLVGKGGLTSTVVDPAVVARYALMEGTCKSVILAHNHPSGKLSPSQPDRDITRRIKEGLSLFDIGVTDHVILSPEGDYYSFADQGVL